MKKRFWVWCGGSQWYYKNFRSCKMYKINRNWKYHLLQAGRRWEIWSNLLKYLLFYHLQEIRCYTDISCCLHNWIWTVWWLNLIMPSLNNKLNNLHSISYININTLSHFPCPLLHLFIIRVLPKANIGLITLPLYFWKFLTLILNNFGRTSFVQDCEKKIFSFLFVINLMLQTGTI